MPAPLRDVLACVLATAFTLVLKHCQSVDEHRTSADAAATEFDLFVRRDATGEQHRLIELQVVIGLPLLTDLERLAKSFTIIERCCNRRGHTALRWLRDGTVKTREDRGISRAYQRSKERLKGRWRWSTKPRSSIGHPTAFQSN